MSLRLQISPQQFQLVENGTKSEDEEDEQMMNVPHEIEVEELVEREVMQDMVETRKVPQVKSLYGYKGQGMKVDKGEVGGDA